MGVQPLNVRVKVSSIFDRAPQLGKSIPTIAKLAAASDTTALTRESDRMLADALKEASEFEVSSRFEVAEIGDPEATRETVDANMADIARTLTHAMLPGIIDAALMMVAGQTVEHTMEGEPNATVTMLNTVADSFGKRVQNPEGTDLRTHFAKHAKQFATNLNTTASTALEAALGIVAFERANRGSENQEKVQLALGKAEEEVREILRGGIVDSYAMATMKTGAYIARNRQG